MLLVLRRKVTVFFSEHRTEEILCVPGTFLYFLVPAVSQENVDLQMRERLRELLCVGMNLKVLGLYEFGCRRKIDRKAFY